MSIRTAREIVTFSAPFTLAGVDGTQPPGEYAVDHDEELIEGLSRAAYRRVATFITLPAITSRLMVAQMVPIDPSDLEAALRRDQTNAASPTGA